MTAANIFRHKDADWFQEDIDPAVANSMVVDEILYEESSDHHHIMIFRNEKFGKVLTIDNVVQVTQADEFIYHEMIVNVPLGALGDKAKNILVIGGGDGGVLRELVRHERVETITLVEIDRDVIDFSRKWMPDISRGAFDDPRLNLVIEDGAKFVAETAQTFDLVIVDSTDPEGPSMALFTGEFYGDCKRILAPHGIVVTQSGLPFIYPSALAMTTKNITPHFPEFTGFQITVPGFSGGPMVLGWAAQDNAVLNLTQADIEAAFRDVAGGFKYYNPQVHFGAFMLPNYIREVIEDNRSSS